LNPKQEVGGVAGIDSRPLSFIANAGYETMPAGRVVESLAAAGYDSVEWTPDHLGSLRRPASALACQQDLVSRGEEAVAITLGAIEAAAEAGIGIVNVVAGPNLWEDGAETGVDPETAWGRVVAGLERICGRAESLGVKIGLEPCWGTIVPDAGTADRMLAEVPVSVCFDPSHFVMTGDPIPDLIRRWGERIIHFHLKDAFGSPGMEGEDFLFTLLGEGNVPWNETFAALEEIGYHGALSVEFEAYTYLEQVLGSDPEKAARLSREQAAALIGRYAESKTAPEGETGE